MQAIIEEAADGYRLSSQQTGLHLAGARDALQATTVIVEGPWREGMLVKLSSALSQLVEGNEALRTVYRAVAGMRDPLQHVLPVLEPVWQRMAQDCPDGELAQAASSRLNLRDGPVVALAVCKTDDGHLRWALALPGLAADAASVYAVLRACLEQLADDAPAAGELVQYVDYAAWQTALFESELGLEGTRHWQGQEALLEGGAPLPFKARHKGEATSEKRELSAREVAIIGGLASRLGQSNEVVLLGIWATWLARITQGTSVRLAWECSARSEEVLGAIGCFTGTLPMNVKLAGARTSDQAFEQVRTALDEALSWRECFDAATHADWRAASGLDAPEVGFEHVAWAVLPEGWSLRCFEHAAAGVSLSLLSVQADGRIALTLHSDGTHGQDALSLWMGQLSAFIQGMDGAGEKPWSLLNLIGDDECQALLEDVRAQPLAKQLDETPASLHALFEAQVRSNAKRHAVVCGDEHITYAELDHRAQVWATSLRRLEVGPGSHVGVLLARSVDAIAAMLAVMKAGATYVPIDPAYPADRIAHVLKDAGIQVAITLASERDRLAGLGIVAHCVDEPAGDAASTTVVAITGHPDSLAYIIYTSGSTGLPKGVMVSHANAVASTLARFEFYKDPVTRYLLLSSFSFDSSVAGIFWTLGQGGTLHIPLDGEHQDPSEIARIVERQGVSHLLALPSLYRQVIDHLPATSGLRCAIVAGEVCHVELAERHADKLPETLLVNEYGPTEATVWSNACLVEVSTCGAAGVPIGRAVSSVHGLVLDERMEPCPTGVAGEWFIGGPGVTRGYWRATAQTAQRFVAHPFAPGQRLYRSGDLVRRRPDGQLEYIGRVDKQVKVRGHRIELGEIETQLLAHRAVDEAAVVAKEGPDGLQLLAFMTGASHSAASLSDVRDHLGRVLPSHMVPSRMLWVAALPRLPNGKVDQQAVLKLDDTAVRTAHVAPDTPTAVAIAEIWQQLLKITQVGLDDHFFELGGHSLLATQVAARIRQRFGVDIPLREVLEAVRLRALVEKVQSHIDAGVGDMGAMEQILAAAEMGH